ncbi:hypothetical protein [Streptomyces sp. AGS-58]|uniref:hypothetical protein n=1 Tax=unclassified Streptomyces TaxID=2593676 RepID=UPI0035A35BBA
MDLHRLRELADAANRADEEATSVQLLRQALALRRRRPTVPHQVPPPAAGFWPTRELGVLGALRAGQTKDPLVAMLARPPGAGKTALAVRWGHQSAGHYPDGQLFANLDRPAGGITRALGGFLRTLGVPAAELPPGTGARATRFAELIRVARVLVVLDHVRDAHEVRALLPAGVDCAALITSRSPLTALVAKEAVAWLEVTPVDLS